MKPISLRSVFPSPLAFALSLLPAACASPTPAQSPSAPVTSAAPASTAFIEDDYPAAIAKARAANVPLFIDTWAAWCHSCLSLRQYVFPSAEVRGVAKLVVWLSIDSEKDVNTEFMKRFPAEALPTLWLVDPRTEKVLVKWTGAPTPIELASIIRDASAAYASGEPKGAEAALLRGDRASTDGNRDDAIAAYKDALAAATPAWSKRAHVLDALTFNLGQAHESKECFDLAKQGAKEAPPGTARASLLATALGCGLDLDAQDQARADLGSLADLAVSWANDSSQPIMADDRSGLFEAAIPALTSLGQKEKAHAAATNWSTYLDGEASRAKTPGDRAVFDPHRLNAYIELGTPARAIPMLEQSAADFPSDYNPHARLAIAYEEMKRFADADREIDRALALGFGPRRIRLFIIKAEIAKANGNPKAAEAALKNALEIATNDPLAKLHSHAREQVEKLLRALPR